MSSKTDAKSTSVPYDASHGGTYSDGIGNGREALISELLTVEEVAAKLRVPRSWVHSHADDLGVIRAGKYLRFDWLIVRDRLAAGVPRGIGAPDHRPAVTHIPSKN